MQYYLVKFSGVMKDTKIVLQFDTWG